MSLFKDYSCRCAVCIGAMDKAKFKTHGRNGYFKGCRCEICVTKQYAHMESLKGKEPPTHGRSGYRNYKCRCDICKAAGAVENAKHRAKVKARDLKK